MESLGQAGWLAQTVFAVLIAAAFWWWGSWHRSKYPKKHERLESGVKDAIKKIETQGGDKLKALEREMDAIAAKAEAEKDELLAAFHAKFGKK